MSLARCPRPPISTNKRQSTTFTTSPFQRTETAPRPWLILTLMSVERRLHATPMLLRPARLAICPESTATSPVTRMLPTPTTSLPSRRALAPSLATGVSCSTSGTRPASLAPTSSPSMLETHAVGPALHPPPRPAPAQRPRPASPPAVRLPPLARRSAATRLPRDQAHRRPRRSFRLPETPTPRQWCSPPELRPSHSFSKALSCL